MSADRGRWIPGEDSMHDTRLPARDPLSPAPAVPAAAWLPVTLFTIGHDAPGNR